MLRNVDTIKICVFGIGGIGGYFGHQMAQQISNRNDKKYEIYFIARGDHFRRIKEEGLILSTIEGNLSTVKPTYVADKLTDLPKMDIVFLCVKGYDLNLSLQQLEDKLHEKSIIIPLLNGIDIYERIRKKIKIGLVMPGCVYVSAFVKMPGVIQMMSPGGTMVFGRDPNHFYDDIQSVLDFLNYSKIGYGFFDNVSKQIWKKYMGVASFALVTACYNITCGQILSNKDFYTEMIEIMHEVTKLAAVQNIELTNDDIEDFIKSIEKLAYDSKSSYQRDIEIKGRKNEGELFGETMLRLSQKYNVETPIIRKTVDKIEENLVTKYGM